MTYGGPADQLAGVRLGELERTLLMAAPMPGDMAGMPIEDPAGSRSTRQSYLRAATKLERCGLIERQIVREATRAFDPRRTKPMYKRGRFYLPSEPTRRHTVRRIFIWVTPLGDAIRRVYKSELAGGRPIRWTPSKLRVAELLEARSPVPTGRDRDARDAVSDRFGTHEPEGEPVEAVPRGVDRNSPSAMRRWYMAIALARRDPSERSRDLWDRAEANFESETSDADLEQQLGGRWRPPPRRPLRFSRGALGQLTLRA